MVVIMIGEREVINKMDFLRQKNIYDPDKQKLKIKIIGAGSTGSFISLNLAKLGFKDIEVTDFDKVEKHNIPNQFYRVKDCGKLKVDALKEIIKEFTGTTISISKEKITAKSEIDVELDTLIIFCLDNMKTRQIIFDKIKDMPIRVMDTRMGGEGFQIYTGDLSNEATVKFFDERLKAPTVIASCGQKATIYTVLSIASECCNIVKMMDKGEDYPRLLKREMKQPRFIVNIGDDEE